VDVRLGKVRRLLRALALVVVVVVLMGGVGLDRDCLVRWSGGRHEPHQGWLLLLLLRPAGWSVDLVQTVIGLRGLRRGQRLKRRLRVQILDSVHHAVRAELLLRLGPRGML
jgi:hypothetical protein